MLPDSLRHISDNPTAGWLVAGCALVGALSMARTLLSLLTTMLQAYLIPGVNLKRYGAGQGAWALVTGCTDGIGREFALQLAQKGFNVLLVSRSQDKLDSMAEEIESAGQVKTKTFAIDFADATKDDYERLDQLIKNTEIGVLVNNVGVCSDMPTAFHEETSKMIRATVDVNIRATLEVTKSVIPQMVARHNGLILNIGSGTALAPTPLLSTYSASKSFLSTWSQGLGAELSQYKVLVQHITSYYVVTKMSKIRKSSWMIPMPRDFVRATLAKIGVTGGTSYPFHSVTYPGHALANWIVENTVSRRLVLKIAFDESVKIRQRALKKRERMEAEKKE